MAPSNAIQYMNALSPHAYNSELGWWRTIFLGEKSFLHPFISFPMLSSCLWTWIDTPLEEQGDVWMEIKPKKSPSKDRKLFATITLQGFAYSQVVEHCLGSSRRVWRIRMKKVLLCFFAFCHESMIMIGQESTKTTFNPSSNFTWNSSKSS